MSRTTLCLGTATGLTIVSLAFMVTRYTVMGSEVQLPVGPNTWRVTMKLQGTFDGDTQIKTAMPLDVGRQRVLREAYDSGQLLNRPVEARHPNASKYYGRGVAAKRMVNSSRTASITSPSTRRARQPVSRPGGILYEEPQPGAYLDPEKGTSAENERISSLAAQLSEGSGKQGRRRPGAVPLCRLPDQE